MHTSVKLRNINKYDYLHVAIINMLITKIVALFYVFYITELIFIIVTNEG